MRARLRIIMLLSAQSLLATFPCHVIADRNLDPLFDALRKAPNEQAAQKTENQIWMQWFKSGNKEIDALMQQAMAKRRSYDFNGALQILNEVITRAPDYPEAWNQRATVYFHQQEYEKSLEDVARTLQLEPRHFGAMAGRAVIRMQQLKPALARQNVLEAMELHPYLKERAFFPDLLH